MSNEIVFPQGRIPEYQCHKRVRAAKIESIEFDQAGGARIMTPIEGDGHFLQIFASCEYREKFKGSDTDLGYLVIYADGYESWSPTQAFEDGYSKVN